MYPKFKLSEHSSLLSIIAKLMDILLYVLAAFLAYYLQFRYIQLTFLYKIAFLVALLLVNPIFSAFGVYQSLRGRSFTSYMRTLCLAFITLMIVLAALAFVTKTGEIFSRNWFLMWQAMAFVLLTLFRITLRQILNTMRKRGFNQKYIVIIGTVDAVHDIIQRTQQALWSGFTIAKIFVVNPTETLNYIANIAVEKVPENLSEYIEQHKIDEVWFASASWEYNKIHGILSALNANVVTIRYFPLVFGVELLNHSVAEIFGLPVINIVSSPMTGVNRIIKAIEDRVLASIILLLISPIFLVIAVLVKLSSKGPVFYKQMRHGWDGKPICVYKFRSMVVHQEQKGIVTQATSNDARVTSIGKLLRKTSLDELPQFINVLQGAMSIVGPRPHALEHNELYKKLIPAYMQRHQVKPGITGWAQVNGWRGETDALEKMQKRLEYDLYYINHWSLWFDIKIIFLTVFKGFVHKNAY